ncbi:hypothetical protein GCM10022403_043540 [Streptomyces coacervatus]|uniref:C2H2-type domain-containing protein n=1 Tax=Streptomyces coacervatus TaxID=647381 RepID=A0ABP7HY74_9ACTN|nr:hypothetical protein [Streptomyces coacervatus]MDF2267068.1 hypothetical protein [Streptomyces coacervatus]
MSEIAGQTGPRGAATAVVHESYSFACMRCGSGWEQSFAIEHHQDAEGHEFVMYVADGQVVPSPLSKPTCQNCDSHVVRIMRPGQVSSVRDAVHKQQRRTPQAEAPEPAAEGTEGAEAGERDHHWHLSDLLHPFHRKAS